MTAKRVILTAQARRDLRQATAWYRQEGGAPLARRWVVAVEGALRHIGSHPKTGATRYAMQLKLDELRTWPINGFPYLVFYIEHPPYIQIGRVLQAQRDIPEWMGASG